MKNLCNGGGGGRILLVMIILMASIDGLSRGRRSYRNTLMRMHYHSWSVSDLVEGLLIMIQNWLVPDSSATKAQSRDSLLFLFDGQNNGSSNFLGLNVSQRNVAYVSTYLCNAMVLYVVPYPTNWPLDYCTFDTIFQNNSSRDLIESLFVNVQLLFLPSRILYSGGGRTASLK